MTQYLSKRRITTAVAICMTLLLPGMSNVSNAASKEICQKLKDKSGVFLVSDAEHIVPLKRGGNSAVFDPNAQLYFVMGAGAVEREVVSHLRIVTTSANRIENGTLRKLKLSRSKIDSNCYTAGWLEKFFGDGSWQEQEVDAGKYDAYRYPKNRKIDETIRSWHFDWDNGYGNRTKCENTADHIPFFNTDVKSAYGSQVAQVVTPAYAGQVEDLGPKARTATMVLVHRSKTGSACHSIRLPGARGWIPYTTRIETMRLGERKTFNRFGGVTIYWKRK